MFGLAANVSGQDKLYPEGSLVFVARLSFTNGQVPVVGRNRGGSRTYEKYISMKKLSNFRIKFIPPKYQSHISAYHEDRNDAIFILDKMNAYKET